MTAALDIRQAGAPPVMGGPTLMDEWSGRPLPGERQLALFNSLGISLGAQIWAGEISLWRVRTYGRLYTPDPIGQPLVIVPVWAGPAPYHDSLVERAWLDDLIAFDPRCPERWWYRTGNGGILGEALYLAAINTGLPVKLFADPLAWLQADCLGVVFLEDMERRLPCEAAPDWDELT